MHPKSEWEQGVYDPGAFKLDHLESTEPIFAQQISTFLTGHMQNLPFPACKEKGTKSAWEQGVYDPRAFKLDHLESTKPIFKK